MTIPTNLYKNPLSRFAGVMAIMVFIILAALLLLDYLGIKLNPIIGILTYTLFPGLLFFYLFLIPIGMYREWRRRQRRTGEEEAAKFPRFDFNEPLQRFMLYVFILGTSLVGLLVLAVSYSAYHFTESVGFCSDICHQVMQPEAVTYKASPHVRVRCVQCHVGEGATWYVKSKLSGLYQVYATLLKKYPQPIETPVTNLRPSSDTCEQCHWPTKFFGAKQVVKNYYQEDERNTQRQLYMLLNVGGGLSPTGIHWHVGSDEVYYIPRDKTRQDIPWVKVKAKDGGEIVYEDTENPLKPEEITKDKMRKMDCIDCHNRPTHIFKSPRVAMDEALAAGDIDRTIPYVKKLGVELLSKEYSTIDEAKEEISKGVVEFYKTKYPSFAEKNKIKLETAVSEMQKIYQANNFPYMKSKWNNYPNNVGHLVWPGCFRCHNGKHKNNKGMPIKKECNICHVFLNEKAGNLVSTETSLGRPFEHPADVGGQERVMTCNTCHSGK